MPLLDSDIKLKQSANHPTDDDSTAGGAISATEIDNSSVGEWLPNLDGQIKGGTDQYQWQVAYVHNTSATDTLVDPVVSRYSTLDTAVNEQRARITSASASDDNTKFVRLYGRTTDTGPLKFEDVTLAASSNADSAGIFAQYFRAELRSVSTGELVTAAADIEIKERTSGFNVGFIAAGTSVATNEWKLAVPASIGDVSTFSNRKTEPSGITYSGINADSVDLPSDLGPGQYCAVYCRQHAIPGMPSLEADLKILISGTGFSGADRFHTVSQTQKMAGIPRFDHIGEAAQPLVETDLLGHSVPAKVRVETEILGHSSAATPTWVETDLLGHSAGATVGVETDLLGHTARQGKGVETDILGHSTAAKVWVETDLLGHSTSTSEIETPLLGHTTCACRGVETDLLGHSTRQFSAPATLGGEGKFSFAIRTGGYVSDDLNVTFNSSTGGSSALCQSNTLVISERASEAQTFSLNLNDRKILWHPYGTGAYKDVMAEGAEVDIKVEYDGIETDFHGIFKAPFADMAGPFAPAGLRWPGVGISDKLYSERKTLGTLNRSPLSPVVDKHTAMREACAAVGVDCDVTGILNQRLGGPYHRQNVTPGDLFGKLLELTIDEYRSEYKTVKAYDPDNGGQTWVYSLDDDNVKAWNVAPLTTDVYDQIVVLRAVATGEEFTDEGSLLEVNEFGQYTMTFNPPISLATTRVEFASHLGVFSDQLWYRENTLVAARNIRGYNGLTVAEGNRIYNCDRLVVTWGERRAEGTLTGAPGALRVYGRKTPSGIIGEGLNSQEQLDPTTRRVRGSGDREIELPPNPLFYSAAEMDLHGDRYLARVARAQKEMGINIPLNPLIRNGDTIRLNLGRRFGNQSIDLLTVGWTHSISRTAANRGTNVRAIHYAA